MAKLNDFPITEFKGVVKNKSDLMMEKGEMKQILNMEIGDSGRATRRKGSVQCGQTLAAPIINSFSAHLLSGNLITNFHLVAEQASSANIYPLRANYLTAAVSVGDTTITMGTTANFDTPTGTVEIEGDTIAYTGTTGTTLTGCTGILKAHAVGTPVRQFSQTGFTVSSGVDTRCGCYFFVLGGKVFANGRVGSAYTTGSNWTAVSDADEAGGLFDTVYRNRVYRAGSGASDGSGTRNGSVNRVSYSDAGDGTSWTLTNYFDVEDDNGEEITGLKVLSDRLLIFKLNSMFGYDEVQLKQKLYGVGAYNHFCTQKIGNLIYTFCPSGVWITNGYSARKISEPIDEYLKYFKPVYDSLARVITNCFTGTYRNKFYLYLKNLIDPDTNANKADVVLVYDTIDGTWSVEDSYTNFIHFLSCNHYVEANAWSAATSDIMQTGEFMFGADSSNKYYKLFEDRFLTNAATRVIVGGDLIPNLISNDSGNAISTVIETPMYYLGSPEWWKKIEAVRILIESGDFDISYRIDKGDKITDWIPLGNFHNRNKRVSLKDKEGYGIAFKITGNSKDTLSTFNGIIVESIETLQKK